MKSIKNTWKLFALDWKRIFKNPVATFLIVALMIIPSLYAWFNIKALWTPMPILRNCQLRSIVQINLQVFKIKPSILVMKY